MITVVLPDVNILVHAHRSDSAHHAVCRTWLESVLASDQAYGMSELVLSGFVRVVTHPRDLHASQFHRIGARVRL